MSDVVAGVTWDVLRLYVEYVRDTLGLSEWTIHLKHQPCEDHYFATIQPTYGRKHARLSLCPEWAEYGADARRVALIHELLHLHFNDVDRTFDHIACALPKTAVAMADAAFTESLEYGIDGVAAAMAPFFLLPTECEPNEAVSETRDVFATTS